MHTIDKFYKNDIDLDSNHHRKDFREKTTEFIERTRRKINKIQNLIDKKMDHDNIVEKLAMIEFELESENNKIKFLRSVFPDQILINTTEDMEKFVNEINMREDLYKSLKNIRKKKVLLPNEWNQYLNKVILKKKRRGLDLTEEKRNQLKQIEVEITKLCNDFNDNVTNNNNHIAFDSVELDGLTGDFLSNLEMRNNQYIVDRNLSHIMHILKYCRDISTREKIYIYKMKSGGIINELIFEKILKLRHWYAQILGYQNYVDYTNEAFISKNGSIILGFLVNLAINLEESSRRENEILLALKRHECEEMSTPFDQTILSFDSAYYQRVFDDEFYSLDENFIKQYFPIDHVTQIILEIYQTLLNLVFYKIDGATTWHESVTIYSVHDKHSTNHLGYFYLDLFTRQGKSSEIFHAPFKSIGTTNTDDQLPYAVMVANFIEPNNDKPSLLTHADIIIFFGRFSFVIHNIICKTPRDISDAISVENYFIRAIMYMFEKFAWEESIIKKLSSHYITKEKLSDDLITKLSDSRKANASIKFRFEIAISIFDYKLHTTCDADAFDVYEDCMKNYTSYLTKTETSCYTQFSPMYNNLNAKYYTNLWSEVIACDIFVSRFKKEGILNEETGMSFRKNIIEPGSTKSNEELLEDFLGRNHNIKSFLEFYGLK